ncbi:MAG: hypothetical protein ACREX8_20025, partial [Gammaproteobacteria bacterium]
LKRQLSARRAMEEQMRRFYEEMNGTLTELDALRSELRSPSGPSAPAEEERLAEEVRDLRRGMGKVGDDLAQAKREESGLDAYPGL